MKNIYKNLALFCLLIVFCCSSTNVSAQAWDGTTVTEPTLLGDVYQISNGAELAGFAALINGSTTYLNEKNAVLTADIDLADKAWTPIGNSKTTFSGIFDGAGHNITGLNVSLPATEATTDTLFSGLFGFVAGATIKHFAISGNIISPEGWSGGVAGNATYTQDNANGRGTVLDSIICSVNMTIYGPAGRRGGIAGSMAGKYATDYYIRTYATRCVYKGIMVSDTTATNMGGIAGYATSETRIQNCCNLGKITQKREGDTYVAGILGYLNALTHEMSNCFNWGYVNKVGSQIYAGSILGTIKNIDADSKNCFYLKNSSSSNVGAGSVTAGKLNPTIEADTATFISGKIAYLLGNTIWGQKIGTDSFPGLLSTTSPAVYKATIINGTDTTYQYTNAKVVMPVNPTAETGQAFIGWFNGENIFCFDGTLTSDVTLKPKFADAWDASNSTTPTLVDDVYQIGTAADLAGYAAIVNSNASYYSMKNAVLTADIDLADKMWTPMGTSKVAFSGIFDGAGHTISGLNICVPGTATTKDTLFVGLFGFVDGGVIKNMTVSGNIKTVEGYTGGIAGYVLLTKTISATRVSTLDSLICNVNMYASNTGGRKGGIIGSLTGYSTTKSTMINRCAYNGTMILDSISGGNCGGLIGYSTSYATLQNCYNAGEISLTNPGAKVLGGILGYINATTFKSINNHNWGKVTKIGDQTLTGAIFGSRQKLGATSKNCFYVENSVSSNLGIGKILEDPTVTYVDPSISADSATYRSGEVAYKLGNTIWGQKIGTDLYPVFKSAANPAVYKVTFMALGVDTTYQYANDIITKPADPTKADSTFTGWYNGETAFDFNTAISADVTLKAKFTFGTALDAETVANVCVYASNHEIIVKNADGQLVSVYDLTGSLVAKEIAGKAILVGENGVYVVKVSDKVYKVILK